MAGEPVQILDLAARGIQKRRILALLYDCLLYTSEYTLKYMDVLRRLGKEIPDLAPSLCHIIASGMFNGLFEIVVHDMPREQAHQYMSQFRTFYTAGWLKLMGQ